MTNREKLKARGKEAAALFREAISYNLRAWDAIREIEVMLGCEIDGTQDSIDNICVILDKPEDVNKIGDEWLIEELEKLLCNPDDNEDVYK